VDHAHSVDRPFSWRGAALAVGLLLVIALAGLGGAALLRQLGKSTPAAAHTKQPPARPTVTLRPRSAMSVVVMNGNGANGAAGAEASQLLALGYGHATSTDAQNHDYARSLVLFRRGYEGEARRLAQDAGIRTVAPLDGRLPSAFARAQLSVILGR